MTLCEVYVIFEDCRAEGFEVVRDRLPPRDQPCSRSAFAGAVKSMIEVAELPEPTPLLHVDIPKPVEDFQPLQISKRLWLATTKLSWPNSTNTSDRLVEATSLIVPLHSKETILCRRLQIVACSHVSMGITLTPPSGSLPVSFCPVPLGHSIRSA